MSIPAKATSKDLYSAYVSWCEENGEKPPFTKNKFGRMLGERGFKSVKVGTCRWQGIGIRE